MSARLALSIALILLFLLAVVVIVVAGLVRRPRREWQVAVRGQAQEVRYVGSSSTRSRPIRPRKTTLDEIWATNSVPRSAYVGAPKLPDRDQVAAALAPAPQASLLQFVSAAAMPKAPSPPPPPRDYLGEDPFYEPEVVTGEISLFNAAVERPNYDDARWEGVDSALDEGAPTIGLARAQEVLSKASATTASWLSEKTADLRRHWDSWKQRSTETPNQEAAGTMGGEAQEDAPVVGVPEESATEDSAEVARPVPTESPEVSAAPVPAVVEKTYASVEEDDEEILTVAEVEEGDDQWWSPAPPPPSAAPTAPSAPPPAADDLERWVATLKGDPSQSTDHPHPRWRRTEGDNHLTGN